MSKKRLVRLGFFVLAIALVACSPGAPALVSISTPVEVTREVQVEVTRVAEVTREVPVPVTPTPEPTLSPVSDYEGTLNVSVWGGVTEEWLRNFVEPEFKKIYPNVTFNYDVGGMSARYTKLLAQKANPDIDVFMSTGEALFGAINEGLVQKIDRSKIPNMQGLNDWALPAPDYGAAYAAIAEGLCYNPTFFGDNPPKSWQDLWRPEVQGKLSVPAIGHSQMPQFVAEAAQLNGGSVGNIQPGLDALAKLRPAAQTFFYTGWNAQFDAGDIVLAVDFDYYCNFMAQQGSNIKFVLPEEGGWGSIQHASIVVGTKNPEMVEAYINLLLSPEIQHSVAFDALNSPSRPDVRLSPELEQSLAVAGDNATHVKWFDEKFSVEVRPAWTELLNIQVAPAWGK